MTTSPIPTIAVVHEKRRQHWVRPALYAAGGIVLLVVGVVIGIASQQSTITSYKHQVAQLQGQVSTAKTNLATDQGKLASEQIRLSTAQTAAKNAMATALAQVQAQYKSKLAKVTALQKKLAQQEGAVQRSTISADGVYVVGKDIPSGTYHTSGNNGGFNNQCYYATLGSTDTSNILDNNNFNGPEMVDVSGAYAFQIVGGCVWHLEG
jgi:hypothetical protein